MIAPGPDGPATFLVALCTASLSLESARATRRAFIMRSRTRRHYIYMPYGVGKARKRFGVKYPALYAPESNEHGKEFNCVQRGASARRR